MEALLNMLPGIQIALAIILVGAILLQQRGAGLGGAFGGGEGSVHYERRGFERTLFKTTIFIAIIFVISVMASLFIDVETDIQNIEDVILPTPTENDITISPEDITFEINNGETDENIEMMPIDVVTDDETTGSGLE